MFRKLLTMSCMLVCSMSLLSGISSLPETASAATPISTLDTTTYEKPTLVADGKPFFFNGIQIRDDKILTRFNYNDAQMQNVYQLAADNGFTVANSQILWSMVQPDQQFSATASTYISGGTNASTNFSTSSSVKAKYDAANTSNQALTYLKFDFSTLLGTSADAAKIRIYVNSMDTGTANLHLYGITDDSWNASTMTWNNGAPNHSGYNVTGTLGTDLFDLGVTPSYDPVNQVAFYDFDVTDFINNHAFGDGKKASFILQTDTTNNIGVTMDGAAGTTAPPKLVISRANAWDYSWVDKVIGFAENAKLKLELMWFGSDTTKQTIDSRVPYYVIRNYTKMQTSDGRSLISKTAGYTNEGVYIFRMSKNDPNLRAQEYTALKNLFDHVAVYNTAHGNKKTVIGADISNEPGNDIGDARSYDAYSNADYTAGGYTSHTAFEADSYWTWVQNLGAAVKQSNYPVWTRINFHTFQVGFVNRNEDTKAAGGTSYVDFVGYDPYIGTTDEGYRYGLGLWPDSNYLPYNYGQNYPMIMETSAARSNSDYLNLATIAGGSAYNLYNMMANDGNDMYNNGTNNVPVANNTNIAAIKNTNIWLKSLGYDLATKKPDSAGGTKLKFFNERGGTSANITKKLRGMDVNYTTSNQGVGIAVEESDKSIALASKTASTFTLKNALAYGPVTMTTGSFDVDNNWISQGSKTFTTSGDDVVVSMNAYETILVQTTKTIPILNTTYALNDNFNSQATGAAPSGWTTSGSIGGSVTITEKPGLLDKSFRINRTATTSGQSYASKSFAPLNGIIKLKARTRFNATSSWFGAPFVFDSQGNTLIAIAFDASGNIVYKNSSGAWTTLQTYSSRAWYDLDMTLNTYTDTYDLYINGVKMLSQAPFVTPVSNIAKVQFYTENAAGVADFDSIKVYQETAPVRYEGEFTSVTANGTTISNVNDSAASGGGYSQTASSSTTGNWVEYTLNVPVDGVYNVNFGYKKNTNRGTVQLAVDGVNQGSAVDEYSASAAYSASDLGNVMLSAGNHTFRFTVTGMNTSSSSYSATFDYIELMPQVVTSIVARSEGEATSNTTSGVTVSNITGDSVASGGGYLQTSNSTAVGDWVEFTINVPVAGTYNVDFGYKKNTNRGITQLTVDGVNLGSTVDQYSSPAAYSATDLGNVTLSAGNHLFRFTVTGKNSSSSNYNFTVDYLELTLN
ncbi:DUF7594 domain-containing protein [Paenibacillus whitsoniae]|uniref:DNRLRE domain-containing protein n=1 Tax=Paenibacillus whitsoniae TaxID=2496558 RepID=A0A3S0BY37_9BACL|nr:DNRLRE domain-containing protein [Paenibacillus whitsoniae]RTE10882.1 DNRLRE domain-containing protein [Paenibacillus whitsoniae]